VEKSVTRDLGAAVLFLLLFKIHVFFLLNTKFNTQCYNDKYFGRLTPGRLIDRPGVGHAQGVFVVFSYYKLVIYS
jgi:hypothetical protein